MIRTPGTRELLEEAARTGAVDRIGGIDPIGFDEALDEQLDVVFGIADRHGVGVDIHLHERAATGLQSLRAIIARTRALSLQGKVTVSHVFCVPGLPERELDQLAAELADAGISSPPSRPAPAWSSPSAGCAHTGSRSASARTASGTPGAPSATPTCCTARTCSPGYATPASTRNWRPPSGRADGGARLLGLPETDLKPGSPADFLLVRGACLPQILVDLPQRDLVVRAGRVVARDGELTGR
ncbi:amidohydrolase family protein [Actinomadura keratinilytica]